MSNTVTIEDINKILDDTLFTSEVFGNKTTILKAQLPNGFVIVESSSCVDPANFNHSLGIEICQKRVIDKIWELEGYCLQKKLSEGLNNA